VLYCFFVIGHGRRKILHFNVTEHPTCSWIVPQLREVFPEDRAPQDRVLDRDRKFNLQVENADRAGVYANFALVSSGEHDIMVDFCQMQPQRDESDPPRARVVSRVRIAPTFVGPLLQAISSNAFTREENLRKLREQQEGGEPS